MQLLRTTNPVMQLLINCGQPCGAGSTGQKTSELLAQPIDWETLLEAADYHALTPLLWNHLRELRERLPKDVAVHLRRVSTGVTQSNLRLVSELARVLPALSPATLPYKGPLLAEYLYGNIGLRPAIDLDIVVPPESAHQSIEILQSKGFVVDPPLTKTQMNAVVHWGRELTLMRDGVAFDLHWDLAPRGLGLSVDFDSILARTSIVRLSGFDVLWPSPEDQLILLAVHAAKHLWRKLAWVADIAALVRREPAMSLEVAWSRSRQWRCENMVLVSLMLAERIFDVSLPPEVQARTDRSSVLKSTSNLAMEAMCSMRDLTLSRNRHLTIVKIRERMADKFRYACSVALEPQWGDITAVSLPSGTSWLYPAVRILRLSRVLGSPN